MWSSLFWHIGTREPIPPLTRPHEPKLTFRGEDDISVAINFVWPEFRVDQLFIFNMSFNCDHKLIILSNKLHQSSRNYNRHNYVTHTHTYIWCCKMQTLFLFLYYVTFKLLDKYILVHIIYAKDLRLFFRICILSGIRLSIIMYLFRYRRYVLRFVSN